MSTNNTQYNYIAFLSKAPFVEDFCIDDCNGHRIRVTRETRDIDSTRLFDYESEWNAEGNIPFSQKKREETIREFFAKYNGQEGSFVLYSSSGEKTKETRSLSDLL
jgi:hypothetical protein